MKYIQALIGAQALSSALCLADLPRSQYITIEQHVLLIAINSGGSMIITGQFNDSLPPIMDGVAITAQSYAYWLNRNHAPSFAIGPDVPNYEDSHDNILRFRSLRLKALDPYRLGFPRVDREFNEIIEEIPFDLVHAHCPFVSGNYAYTLAQKRKIPLVTTFHSKYRDDFASWMNLDITINQAVKFIVSFYEQADSVWVPNEAIIETLREYGYKGPIEYVPNGSDIALKNDEDRSSLAAEGREILQAAEDAPVLLYLGQHRWIKNLKVLINALGLLKQDLPDFQMRFVGSGSDAEEMQKLADERKLEKQIRFIGPIYDREKLRKVFAATDLMLFPSLYDNASLATREAAGFSIPTLFVRGATTANGIVDGENGFLAENSPEAYAGRIRQILADPDSLAVAGRGARDFLYTSWEEIAATAYEKYGGIIDRYKWRQLNGIIRRGGT
jgi:1,2-diacylglycerol 3-alpha-glucosyltransferase